MRTDEIAPPETMTPRGQDVLDWSVTLTAAVGLGVLVLPWVPQVAGPLVTSTGLPSARGVSAPARGAST